MSDSLTLYSPMSGIVISPSRIQAGSAAAVLMLVPRRTHAVWSVVAHPEHVSDALAARVAALLVIHRQHPILHPVVNPRREMLPCAFFLQNGLVGEQRHTFPPRFISEIGRVADVLLAERLPYVSAIASAMRGARPSMFHPVPEQTGFAPSDELSWAPLPPVVEVKEVELEPYNREDILLLLAAQDYRADRYLEGRSDDEVLQRAEDALVNIHDFDSPGTLVINLAEPSVVAHIVRLTEVLEELSLRHDKGQEHWLQQLLPRWKLPSHHNKLIASVVSHIATIRQSPSDGLVRYDKRERLVDMLDHGRIRLSPAASFSDDSLNRARQASELALEAHIDTKHTKFQLMDERGINVLANVNPLTATITRRAPSNFLVLCTSRRVSARLFFDFDSYACLIIREREEFLRRLKVATLTVLPGWTMMQDDISYYDPFSPRARQARIPFCKPIRYEYQKEHRVAIFPPKPAESIEHVFLDLGPLHDIATLFVPEKGRIARAIVP